MAVADFFLKIDGIAGESQDAKHKGEIDVMSWSWGATNMGAHDLGGGGGAGKVSMQDFNFVMRMNEATPKLMLACATGQHIGSAVLTCRKAGKGQHNFLEVKMHDLLVSSYQTGGSQGADIRPVDQVSLNFSKIEFKYLKQDSKGITKAAGEAKYDLKQNKDY